MLVGIVVSCRNDDASDGCHCRDARVTKMCLDKLVAWRQRLQRYRASGLTVPRFCQQENVTPASFYYWSRRTREADSATAASSTKAPRKAGGAAVPAAVGTGTTHNPVASGPIEVRLHDSLRVFIPSDCDEAMRLVLQLARTMCESSAPIAKASPFQQVLVDLR